MNWGEFLKRCEEYKATWSSLKEEFVGDVRKYLNNSQITIVYGTNMRKQIEYITANPGSLAISNPDLFVSDKVSAKLIDLAKQYQEIKDLKDFELKAKVRETLHDYDTKHLRVVENRAEVRFPTVNIDFIQQIKQSRYCDKELTNMSMSAINVVLKIS